MAYQRKTEKEIRCPLEYGLDIFGGKWKARVICVLGALGSLRYSQLRQELGNITDAVLSAAVKDLVGDGMVERQAFDEIPPRVEYTLSGKGRSVLPILQGICRWSGRYYKEQEDAPMIHCRRCHYRS